jgi:hypothetical protein
LVLPVLVVLLPVTLERAVATLGLTKQLTQHQRSQQTALLLKAARHIPAVVLLVVLAGHQGRALAQPSILVAVAAFKVYLSPTMADLAAAPLLTILGTVDLEEPVAAVPLEPAAVAAAALAERALVAGLQPIAQVALVA